MLVYTFVYARPRPGHASAHLTKRAIAAADSHVHGIDRTRAALTH